MKKMVSLSVIIGMVSVLFLLSCNSGGGSNIATYSITYKGNSNDGGSAPVDSNEYIEGDQITALGPGSLTLTDYAFEAWNTAADGSSENIYPGDEVTVGTDDIELYARWVEWDREMVSVPGGTFTEIADDNRDDTVDTGESFEHTISDFRMAKYEVSYQLWYSVYDWAVNTDGTYTFANAGQAGNDGTGGVPAADTYEPVTNVNWRDMIVWCNAYSEMLGYDPVYYTENTYNSVLKTSTNNGIDTSEGTEDNPFVKWDADGFRLPTQGEWQYAASYIDGTNWIEHEYASGDSGSTGNTSTYAWYGGSNTSEIGQKEPNDLDIYDMSGNVWEKCWDWYGTPLPSDPQTDYQGPSYNGTDGRVSIGGCFNNTIDKIQVGEREDHQPETPNIAIGFRVVRRP